MTLNEEQVKNIKEQILKQIDSWQASEEKKHEAKSYIQSLNSEQLEEFLVKNKMIKQEKSTEQAKEQKPKEQPAVTEQKETTCPFCLIIQGKLSSHKIDENSQSIAVLEINPLSKGHVLVIPKEHKNIDKISSQAFTLAKKLASRIKRTLKPKEISIQSAELFEHGAINLIPIYEDEKLEKKHASEQDLQQLQQLLAVKPKVKKEKSEKAEGKELKKPKKEILPEYPRRLP